MKIKIIFLVFFLLLFNSCILNSHNDIKKVFLYVPMNYSTIQEAVNIADENTIIVISPGTYVESIKIDKKVTIMSKEYFESEVNSQNTIINTNRGKGFIIGEKGELYLFGLTIANNNDGIYSSGFLEAKKNNFLSNVDGIDLEKGQAIITDNVFDGNSDDAIDFDGNSYGDIVQNKIYNSGDDGIEIRFEEYLGDMLKINISNNDFRNNTSDGIQFIGYPKISKREIKVINNFFIENNKAAIGYMDNAETVEDYRGASLIEKIYIANNTLVGNNYGIIGGANTLCINNIILNTSNIGAKNINSFSEVKNNLFFNNGIDFINLNESSNFFVEPSLTTEYYLNTSSFGVGKALKEIEWNGYDYKINSQDLGVNQGSVNIE